jgi:hypothetical protein
MVEAGAVTEAVAEVRTVAVAEVPEVEVEVRTAEVRTDIKRLFRLQPASELRRAFF